MERSDQHQRSPGLGGLVGHTTAALRNHVTRDHGLYEVGDVEALTDDQIPDVHLKSTEVTMACPDPPPLYQSTKYQVS